MFMITTNTQHMSLHRSVNIFASGLQMWSIIEQFTDFNTHCCPKIRLRGWEKASHCTFVALIHLIQWTIALTGRPTGPAKHQKKTSSV